MKPRTQEQIIQTLKAQRGRALKELEKLNDKPLTELATFWWDSVVLIAEGEWKV
jgi:hypothetical protein